SPRPGWQLGVIFRHSPLPADNLPVTGAGRRSLGGSCTKSTSGLLKVREAMQVNEVKSLSPMSGCLSMTFWAHDGEVPDLQLVKKEIIVAHAEYPPGRLRR